MSQSPNDESSAQLEPRIESKSEAKRAMLARREMIETAITLPESTLSNLIQDENLLMQIISAKSMKRAALKRQTGFINKLMDENTASVLMQALDVLDQGSAKQNQQFHQLERWRETLLNGDDTLMEKLVDSLHADRQVLRQHVLASRRELHQAAAADPNKPPVVKARRALFKYLKSLQESDSESE